LLKSGGKVLIEAADAHASVALELVAEQRLMTEAKILKDFEGRNRVIVARRV
jgi:methylase of polypeptide subunit release factors